MVVKREYEVRPLLKEIDCVGIRTFVMVNSIRENLQAYEWDASLNHQGFSVGFVMRGV